MTVQSLFDEVVAAAEAGDGELALAKAKELQTARSTERTVPTGTTPNLGKVGSCCSEPIARILSGVMRPNR